METLKPGSILLKYIETIRFNPGDPEKLVDINNTFFNSLTADGIAAAIIAVFTTLLAQFLTWMFQYFAERIQKRKLRDFFNTKLKGIVKTNALTILNMRGFFNKIEPSVGIRNVHLVLSIPQFEIIDGINRMDLFNSFSNKDRYNKLLFNYSKYRDTFQGLIRYVRDQSEIESQILRPVQERQHDYSRLLLEILAGNFVFSKQFNDTINEKTLYYQNSIQKNDLIDLKNNYFIPIQYAIAMEENRKNLQLRELGNCGKFLISQLNNYESAFVEGIIEINNHFNEMDDAAKMLSSLLEASTVAGISPDTQS